ncbi:hypothetical protein C8Q79DRAFT_1050729 [Trametes meyenii]|nr:hypothetical protein C8Q79DRAFT_1050729 [Trametes meyenii]
MPPAYYTDNSSTCYCSLCDQYFFNFRARAQHVPHARNHPKCEKCNLRFANGNELRAHYTVSLRHNFCSSCDKHFATPAGFRAHVELTAMHGGDSDPDDVDGSIDDSYEGWEDDVGRVRFPEENEHVEPSVEDDQRIATEDVYWPEDDEITPRVNPYAGYAPIPSGVERPSARAHAHTHAHTPTPAVPTHTHSEGCKDGACAAPPEEPTAPAGVFCLNCPICLEPASTPTATACGHVFCAPCIEHVVGNSWGCPVCRTFTVPGDLRRLYLSTA